MPAYSRSQSTVDGIASVDHLISMSLAEIEVAGRRLLIELAWVGPKLARPPVVFLHEGLGSVAAWKAFPEKLCAALERPGLVYSRPGYGKSTPRLPSEKWQPDYMHKQAREVLPALLEKLGVRDKYSLFGHSDGGSIALIHAGAFKDRVLDAVVLAPHIIVEDCSVEGIREAKKAYETGNLKPKLARYHDDVDSAFYGWCDAWLNPAFRAWDLRDGLSAISCPMLAIQGFGDIYGTMYQIEGIKDKAPQTQLLKLDCGHAPHAEKEAEVIEACKAFYGSSQGEKL